MYAVCCTLCGCSCLFALSAVSCYVICKAYAAYYFSISGTTKTRLVTSLTSAQYCQSWNILPLPVYYRHRPDYSVKVIVIVPVPIVLSKVYSQ